MKRSNCSIVLRIVIITGLKYQDRKDCHNSDEAEARDSHKCESCFAARAGFFLLHVRRLMDWDRLRLAHGQDVLMLERQRLAHGQGVLMLERLRLVHEHAVTMLHRLCLAHE